MSMEDVLMISKRTEGFIHEQTLVQAINDESIDWIFRNSKTMGVTLCKAFGIESEDLKRCRIWADIVGNKNAITAVGSSASAVAKVFASKHATQLVVNSNVAMTAMTASSTAMNVIAASNVAVVAIIASNMALNIVVNSNVAMTAIVASAIAMGVIAASNTAIQAIINSNTSVTKVIASSTAMNAIAKNSSAMNTFANSQALMEKIVVSSVARNALYSNYSTTEDILAGSNIAKEAMRKSTQYANSPVVLTGGSVMVTAYAGKAFVFSVSSSYAGETPLSHGMYIKDGNTLTDTFTRRKDVLKFASTVSSYVPQRNFTITHEIFKI